MTDPVVPGKASVCGFSFGNGCSDGMNSSSLFGSRKKSVRTPTEVM